MTTITMVALYVNANDDDLQYYYYYYYPSSIVVIDLKNKKNHRVKFNWLSSSFSQEYDDDDVDAECSDEEFDGSRRRAHNDRTRESFNDDDDDEDDDEVIDNIIRNSFALFSVR